MGTFYIILIGPGTGCLVCDLRFMHGCPDVVQARQFLVTNVGGAGTPLIASINARKK